MARAVDVGVVAPGGLILDVANGDGDAARALFGRIVDLVVRDELRRALEGEHLGNRGGQRGFAVVDVADGADVDVRLGALKLLLCHCCLLLLALSGAALTAASLLEPMTGLEPVTSSLPKTCSTC
jgi:hypothetical protein